MKLMRFTLLAVLCVAAFAAEAPKSAYNKATLEAYLRHLLVINPQVKMEIGEPKLTAIPDLKEINVHLTFGAASQDETIYISKDGQHVLRGDIYDIARSPFHGDLQKLTTQGAPAYGTPGAPITMIEFGDFECPQCKVEAQALRQNLVKTFPTQVQFFFKDFPLESIHPWSKAAAIAGRCVYRQNTNAFWDYHDWIYEHQDEIAKDPSTLKSKILDFAKSKNWDTAKLEQCIDSNATEADVESSIAEGKKLRIDGTPTLFINGRRLVGNVPWQNLKQLVDFELEYQKTAPKTASKADEKCCEVKIPSPLNR
ncbi:MAG: thioredoxin domain-containing protein [Gammaproteobacteria bacterium]